MLLATPYKDFLTLKITWDGSTYPQIAQKDLPQHKLLRLLHTHLLRKIIITKKLERHHSPLSTKMKSHCSIPHTMSKLTRPLCRRNEGEGKQWRTKLQAEPIVDTFMMVMKGKHSPLSLTLPSSFVNVLFNSLPSSKMFLSLPHPLRCCDGSQGKNIIIIIILKLKTPKKL